MVSCSGCWPEWLQSRLRRAALVLLGLAACAAGAHAAAPALAPCWLDGVMHEARCGSIKRPLDPARPNGTTIDLHFAVLPALARQPAPDPVFFIAGGPGQSAVDLAGPVSRMLARLGRTRDIVLVDQRGTGRSAPLQCDDAADTPGWREQFDARLQIKRLRDCLARLQALPYGDLRHFGTSVAMADLDAVRQALGAAQINLVAASYGTRAALEYLRLFPQQVRRAVLDGVVPADMALAEAAAVDTQAAFDALLRWCSEDPRCRRDHPHLAQRWQALHASLPRELRIADVVSGRSEPLRLTSDALERLVRTGLYLPSTASALPAAIDAAAQDRFEPLVALTAALSGAPGRAMLAQGMHFAVVCSEDRPRDGRPRAPPSPMGGGLAELYREVCAFWPRGEPPAGFGASSAAGSPVLLLSGGIDPATPPRHGERVARALGGNARHEVVAQAGHGLLALPCITEAVNRFIAAVDDAAALGVEFGCARELPRPPLFVPPGSTAAP